MGDQTFVDAVSVIAHFEEKGVFVKQIECGWDNNLCLDSKGRVWSFGCNENGECGDGSKQNIFTPKIIKQRNAIQIKCGLDHCYFKTNQNEHFLFGYNGYNQCGLIEDDRDCVLTPLMINGIVQRQCNDGRINEVFLGGGNTLILLSKDEEEENKNDDNEIDLKENEEIKKEKKKFLEMKEEQNRKIWAEKEKIKKEKEKLLELKEEIYENFK